MGVNSFPKTVTGQRGDCDLNPGPSAPESSTLTTRLPSHPREECDVLPSACLSVCLYVRHMSNTRCTRSVSLALYIFVVRYRSKSSRRRYQKMKICFSLLTNKITRNAFSLSSKRENDNQRDSNRSIVSFDDVN